MDLCQPTQGQRDGRTRDLVSACWLLEELGSGAPVVVPSVHGILGEMEVLAGTRRLTYQEYAQLPEDGKRHEIIDGAHYVSGAPSVDHQRCAWRLVEVLAAVFERTGRGEVLFAPVDVELTATDVVQPDFVVVLAEHASIVEPSRIVGAPGLVVEIVSPSSRDHDTVRKLDLYERTGVGEYWIVDPEAERVSVYSRSGVRLAEVDAGRDAVRSPLAGRTVPMRTIW